jgi:hypothetical protein
MTTVPLPKRMLGNALGKFEHVIEGPMTLVACGIYEINGTPALKGFKKHSITKILKENPGQTKIKLIIKNHVESWLQAMAQNHEVSDINVFSDIPKVLTLNCDTKRLWPAEVTSDDLLYKQQYSVPLVEHQDRPPAYWK